MYLIQWNTQEFSVRDAVFLSFQETQELADWKSMIGNKHSLGKDPEV